MVKIGSAGLYIALECGATHTGKESLLRLAKAAAAAGADALKVQVIRADDLMRADDPTEITFGTVGGERRESLYGALKRRELPFEDWAEVRDACADLGLAFIATPSGPRMVNFLASIEADALKIAKGDMTYLELVQLAARTGLPLLLDGRERVTELGEAIWTAERAGATNIILVHCASGYPPPESGVHLRAIPILREVFGRPVGFSDHSPSEVMCHAALALGARYIEKSVSENPSIQTVEHSISLGLEELRGFVRRLRAVELALGEAAVLALSRVAPAHRRGLFAAHDLPAFRVLIREDLDCIRPEVGIPVNQLAAVVGRTLSRPVRGGDPIRWEDLT